MPDSKISQLPSVSELEEDDILLAVKRQGNSEFDNKQISVGDFFGSVKANSNFYKDVTVYGNTTLAALRTDIVESLETITDDLVITGNGLVINNTSTPVSSTLDDITYPVGKISYDQNYIYIKVSSNNIKRAILTSF